MPKTITVTEAARNFSNIINRVYYQGNTFLLTRGREVVACLSAVNKPTTGAMFARHWQERPRLDAEDAAHWEAEISELKAANESPVDSAWDS